jgi:hypothetical protein
MDSEEERCYANIRVLAQLTQNDKLCTTSEALFTIYVPTTWRAMWRMYHGERRSQNIQHVRQAVRTGITFAQRSLEEVQALSQTNNRLRMSMVALQHMRMVEGLAAAKGGIANLLQTYRDDAALTSQITLILTEIEDFLKVIHPHTETLRRIE